jgi:hypothetical protein
MDFEGKRSWAYSKYYPGISPDAQKEATGSLVEGSGYHVSDSDRALPEYKSRG